MPWMQPEKEKKKKKKKGKKWAEELHRHIDGQKAHEKMLNITNYQRNANQNYIEVSPHTGQKGHYQNVCKQ